MSELWIASYVALWILVLFLGFLLAGALRQLGLLHLRLGDDPGALITQAGLDRGSIAPDFELDQTAAKPTRLSELSRVARVLIFVNPTCSSCHQLVSHLREVVATRRDFDFIAICRGDTGGCAELFRQSDLPVPIVVDPQGHIETAYQVQYTPFAYVLDYEQRVLIRGVINNWQQLDSLLDQEGIVEPVRAGKQLVTIERERVAP